MDVLALADTLDPGVIGHQIGAGSLDADLERITSAVADPATWRAEPQALAALFAGCSEQARRERWRMALAAIDGHWDRLAAGASLLQAPAPWRLRWRQRLERGLRLWSRLSPGASR